VAEPASDEPEVSSSLEQQDDAAVVKLALSKLNPRHREVLIASMYEEKTTDEIAAQVGLSENATRQLIFRARAAFKKALIGDVDTTGMSAAAILSVAARKAASEGKKVGAAALTLIALVVMSLTVFPGLNRTTGDQMAGAPTTPGTSQDAGSASSADPAPGSSNQAVDDPASAGEDGSNPTDSNNSSEAGSAARPTPTQQSENDEIESILSGPALGGIVNSDSAAKVFVLDQTYTALGDNGLTATFTFNPSKANVFKDVTVEVAIDTFLFQFKPANIELISGKNSDNLDVYMLVGDTTYLFDENGKKWSETELGQSRVKIEVVMEANGTTVKSISLGLFSR
jgi:RNA polymerase sigma-70 factor (ECF subfamily)